MKIRTFFQFVFVLFVTTLFVAACKKSDSTTSPTAATNTPKVVNLAIWTNSVTPEMLAEFEKKTGIKVNISNYSSNEELLAKLQAGAEGYDVVVPSDYMVLIMGNLKLLEPLDSKRIANAADLNPKVLNQYYDAKNEYSLPFSWGTTGIAVNQKLIKSDIKGWKDLFENKELSGKFTLLDDVRETLGAALRSQALSLNAKSKVELEKGKKVLVGAKNRVKGFTSETLPGLVNGEMAVAQAYSVDALMAGVQTKGDIKYILPEDGCTLWVDNIAIPKGAKNTDEAYQLIDFLLSPQVAAARAQTLFSAPSNLKALDLLPADLKTNKGLFPDETVLAKCEMVQDLGESMALWERVWTEVKAN